MIKSKLVKGIAVTLIAAIMAGVTFNNFDGITVNANYVVE